MLRSREREVDGAGASTEGRDAALEAYKPQQISSLRRAPEPC